MSRPVTAIVAACVFVAGFATATALQTPPRGGYVLEYDAEIARNEPGTHNGGGQTIGYSFFEKTPNYEVQPPAR